MALTLSALSSSANFPVPSTRTRAPKILILSVSIANGGVMGKSTGCSCNAKSSLTSVGDENLGVLNLMRAIDSNLLIENESFVEVRVGQFSTLFLDNLNVLKVGRPLFIDANKVSSDDMWTWNISVSSEPSNATRRRQRAQQSNPYQRQELLRTMSFEQ